MIFLGQSTMFLWKSKIYIFLRKSMILPTCSYSFPNDSSLDLPVCFAKTRISLREQTTILKTVIFLLTPSFAYYPRFQKPAQPKMASSPPVTATCGLSTRLPMVRWQGFKKRDTIKDNVVLCRKSIWNIRKKLIDMIPQWEKPSVYLLETILFPPQKKYLLKLWFSH